MMMRHADKMAAGLITRSDGLVSLMVANERTTQGSFDF
jgi:hypothetical protein